jgi:hypothetical protein
MRWSSWARELGALVGTSLGIALLWAGIVLAVGQFSWDLGGTGCQRWVASCHNFCGFARLFLPSLFEQIPCLGVNIGLLSAIPGAMLVVAIGQGVARVRDALRQGE